MARFGAPVALALVALAYGMGCQLVLGIDPDVEVRGDDGPRCDPARVDQDAHHCGVCNHDCLGGACIAGVCQPWVLADSAGPPTDIAVDATYVYWSTSDGSLHRVRKDGTGEAILQSGVTAGIARIALDESHVYFREPDGSSGTPRIHVSDKDGASPLVVATNQPGKAGLASNGSALFWARTDDTNVGGIQRAVPSGAGTFDVSAVTAQDLQYPQEVAADSGFVYFGEGTNGGLWQAAIGGGGAPIRLSGCKDYVNAIAVDEANVYFTTDAGDVTSTQKGDPATNGCEAPSARVLLHDPAGGPALGIALGGELVVWTRPTLGRVSSTAKSGSCSPPPCARDLATNQPSPGRAAADSAAAYYVNQGDGTIRKVAF